MIGDALMFMIIVHNDTNRLSWVQNLKVTGNTNGCACLHVRVRACVRAYMRTCALVCSLSGILYKIQIKVKMLEGPWNCITLNSRMLTEQALFLLQLFYNNLDTEKQWIKTVFLRQYDNHFVNIAIHQYCCKPNY